MPVQAEGVTRTQPRCAPATSQPYKDFSRVLKASKRVAVRNGTERDEFRGRWCPAGGKATSAGPWVHNAKTADWHATNAVNTHNEAVEEAAGQIEWELKLGLADWNAENWPKGVDIETKNTHCERLGVAVLVWGRDKAVGELRRKDIKDIKAALIDSGYRPSYVKAVLSSIRALLNCLLEVTELEANAAARIALTNEECRLCYENREKRKTETVRIGRRDVKRFSDDAPGRAVAPDEFRDALPFFPPVWRPRLMMAVAGGFRVGELPFLSMDRYDFDLQLMDFNKSLSRSGEERAGTKNDRGKAPEQQIRVAPVPRLVAAKVQMSGVRTDGRIFAAPEGGLLSRTNTNNRVILPAMKAAVAAGVCDAWRVKDLRHTFSTRLQCAGVPAVDVAFWMGDAVRDESGQKLRSQVVTTYLHTDGKDTALAVGVMSDYLGLPVV